MTLDQLNRLPLDEARAAFERCCGASAWADAMCSARPYADRDALFAAADRTDASMRDGDWREAFTHHPRIGDAAALRERFATTAAWAGDEQRGASGASDRTIEELAAGNRAYEQKFGYIFIVCATGKSADEMLGLLNARIGNDLGKEIGLAAAEQKKITRLRLEKLLAEGA